MRATFYHALRNESGAVTTDWVVLTGASVALAVLLMSTLTSETTGVAQEIETALGSATVVTLGNIGAAQ